MADDRTEARSVIGIAGPPGAGKTTLARGLAGALEGSALIHFDHYERLTEQPIEDIRRWMESGAAMERLVVPQLAEDLQALKLGNMVTDRATQARISARRFIVFETPLGRRHADTGRHIDFLIWIDTPLDMALARNIRELSAKVDARSPGAPTAFVAWLQAYLDNYLAVVSRLLRMQQDSVRPEADLVIDGTRPPEEKLQTARLEILRRFG